jgi:hypothetical protein
LRRHAGSSQVLDERVGLRSPAVLATNARGDAAAAWVESYGGGRTRLWVALRRPGRRFRAAQQLDPGDARGGTPGTVAVATADDDGTATVGWSARTASGSAAILPVRFATTDARAVFGEAQDLPGASGALRDVAVADDGTAAIAWSARGAAALEAGGLTAAVRPASALAFGPAELVSADPAESTGTADLAFAPQSTRLAVAWLAEERQFRFGVRVSRRG